MQSGNFLQIGGMRIEVNASMPAVEESAFLETTSRVRSLVIEGSVEQVLVDEFMYVGEDINSTLVIATNSYLAGGGGGYFSLGDAITLGDRIATEQDIFEEYVRDVLDGLIDIPDPPPEPSRVSFVE